MKKIIIHNAFFRLFTPVFYGMLVYLLILLINNDLSQIGSTFTNQEVYVCIGLAYLLSEALRGSAILARHFFDNNMKNQITAQVMGGLLLSILVISITISVYFKVAYDFSITESQLIIFNMIYGTSSLLYNLLYFSNVYVHKQNVRMLENENVKRESIESELSDFKNEVNPQLLYESLETLITLIHKDVDEGEEYIDHLSSVYRYILSHRKVELSTLNEEYKAVKNIVYLLNYLYDDQISLKIVFNDKYNTTPLVPGTLPNLVELIVRSTIINKFQPLKIEIVIEDQDGYLVLQHQLNERLSKPDNFNDIFESIQKSYTFYSDKPVMQVKAYDFSYIKIPLLEEVEEPLELEL
ncbi:hypothetical protein FNH22_17585 [Fulvivirga sp. M361]|uniref:histidine kinase n=1 Tax=Fulvivirga sp. M361 TaxID=2594266 RepID=UPI00117A36A1|nr:sensor histidine kinase [Fulvivirga sp. M361]TRX55975.1 hypothetical protein FNH22_17585 [Fulvivirga sp. M361]